MKNLPPKADSHHWLDAAAKPSVVVLAKFQAFSNLVLCRYYYALKEWHIDGFHGSSPEPVEWWLLPETGTGTRVNAPAEQSA